MPTIFIINGILISMFGFDQIKMNDIYVTDVKYLGNFIIECTFNNKVTKKIDMTPLLQYPAYSELTDETLFKQFGLDESIFWSNGADIAPEWLYTNGVEVESA